MCLRDGAHHPLSLDRNSCVCVLAISDIRAKDAMTYVVDCLCDIEDIEVTILAAMEL